MHFLVPRVLQKKQPHRHQEVLLQHPLHPQLNVEVSNNGRPRLLKWLFFLKAVVYTRCAQHWVGGRGARTAPFDRVCVGGCFFWRTRTTSCDKELQTWHQWKKCEDKEAAAIPPIVRKACDICTVGHALRNPTHLLRRSADCEPYPRLQLDSVTAGRDGRGGCGKIYILPCNTTCNTTCNTHATHMQHDMQHDTQHAGNVEKTQGFFFFGHFDTRPAFKTFLLLWLLRNRQKRRIPEFFQHFLRVACRVACCVACVLHVVLHVVWHTPATKSHSMMCGRHDLKRHLHCAEH